MKKRGLKYSEIMALTDLWDRANQEQKEHFYWRGKK